MGLVRTTNEGIKGERLDRFIDSSVWDDLINIAKRGNHLCAPVPGVGEFHVLEFRYPLVRLDSYDELSAFARVFLATAKEFKMPPMEEIVNAKSNNSFHIMLKLPQHHVRRVCDELGNKRISSFPFLRTAENTRSFL